jgi:RNA polymerase sigma-70 factor (sigma-E family)
MTPDVTPGMTPGMTSDVGFDDFVAARYRSLLRFGVLLTGQPDTAYDVLHSALVRTALRWPYIRRRDGAEAYVRRAMVTQWLNARRNRWRDRTPLESVPEPAVTDPDGATHDVVWRALAALPPRQQAVVVLRYYEQLSEAETADVLGCSRGTVKSQTAKAFAHLRAVPALRAWTEVR